MKASFIVRRNWSSHAHDLVRKRFLIEGSINAWLHKVVSHITRQYPEKIRPDITHRYVSLLDRKAFFPTSSALYNATIGKGSLAGCIVFPLSSQANDLFSSVFPHMSKVLSSGMGVGVDLSVLPPRLFPDVMTQRAHPGPIEVLRSITGAFSGIIKCNGVKRAAFMGSLSVHHPEIFSFIFLKTKERIEDVNISVAVDQVFALALSKGNGIPVYWIMDTGETCYLEPKHLEEMQKNAQQRSLDSCDLAIRDGMIYSHSAHRLVGYVEQGRCFFHPQAILDCMAQAAHQCGDPGLLNLEAINADNPTYPIQGEEKYFGSGILKTTTPCGEQPLLPYEVCHLGSMNLGAFARDGIFHTAEFLRDVDTAIRFMDDAVDVSDTGIEASRTITRQNRKIGLGIMGLADALAELEIPYSSKHAYQFADQVGHQLLSTAKKTSEALARERGAFHSWPYSKWCQMGEKPRRHATLTTIAPTGYISTIADCSPSIEPYYLIAYQRNAAGVRLQENLRLEDKLRKIGWSLSQWIAVTQQHNPSYVFDGTLSNLMDNPLDDAIKNSYLQKIKKVFVTSHEIDPKDHMKMMQVFQKYVENGISKTINLPTNTTVQQVRDLFLQSIENNVKGITVFRDKCLDTQALTAPHQVVCCPSCQSSQFLEKNSCGGYSCSAIKGGCGYEGCFV